jgi:hypothetical protein
MNAQDYIVRRVFPVAAAFLPVEMSAPGAWAMLVAIARQESKFAYRRQVASYRPDHTKVYGPARGFWQFEMGGVEGVLEHRDTRVHAGLVLSAMGYSADPREIHLALEHNDVLAAVFARLNLWWSPKALPGAGDAERGWELYTSTWRPGKPHRTTWDEHFAAGWSVDWPGTVRT